MQIANERYKKNPGTFGPKSVLGLYLRTMNMQQYRDLHYEDGTDTEKLKQNALTAPKEEIEIDPEFEANLKTQLENGEITEEQYNTLTRTNQISEKEKDPDHYDERGFLINLEPAPIEPEFPEMPEPEPPQVPQYQVPENY